jgi:nitrate reductase cytochrome c-type subunit
VVNHAKVVEGINNERYNCSACHVPQATNLVELVENDFSKTQPSDAKKDVLDDLNSFEY